MFEDSPISLWQDDCSEVKAYLDSLRDSGVQDIRGYFETHPEALAHCASRTKILDINKATLELFEAESKKELQRDVKHIFTEQSFNFVKENLIAWAEGKTVFEGEDLARTLKGKKVHTIVKLSVLPGFEQSLSRVLVSVIDITKRKQAEEELRKTTETLQALVQASPVAIMAIDPEGIVTRWNPAAERMLGWSEAEAVGQFLPQISPDKYEEHRTLRQRALRGEIQEFEVRRQRKDGSLIDLIISTAPLRDAQGKITGIVSVQIDVTERKQAEEKLRRSEARFRQLVEFSPFPIGIISEDVPEYLNPKFIETFGYTQEDLPNMAAWFRLAYPDPTYRQSVIERWQTALRKATEEDRATEGLEFEMTCKDGSVRNIELWDVHVGSKILGFFIDLTERKRAEEGLRRSEAKYRRLHESMTDAFVRVDMTGRFQEANRAYLEMLGYSEEELRQLTYHDLTPEKWHAWEDWIVAEQILVQGFSGVYEKEYRKKDGAMFPVEMRTFLLRDDAGQAIGMWAIVRDITERKRAEEALRFTQFAVDHSPDAAFWIRPDGSFLYVNEAASQSLGYSREELLSMSVSDIDPNFPQKKWAPHWQRSKKQRKMTLETYHRAKDGRIFPVEVRLAFVEFAGQEFHCSFARDITERKQAEEEIRNYRDHLEKLVAERTVELSKAYASLVENEARYRLLAENISDVIWTMDFDLRFTYLSPSVQLLRGFSPQETMSQSLEEIFTPESLKIIRHVLGEELLREQEGTADPARVREFELEMRRRDGSTIWVEVRASFARDLNLHPVGILGVARDISRRRRVEEALRESEARFRTIFSHAPLGIVLRDLEGHMLEANPAALKIMGYSFDEISRVGDEFVHPDDYQHYQEFMQGLERDQTDHGEMELQVQRKDGAWAWGRLHLSLVREPSGEVQYLLGMIEDISRLKQWEEEIRTYQERLRSLASELTLAEERERRRLATNLHDNIGQVLALTQIKMGSLADAAASPSSQVEMREVRDLITQVIHTTRSLTFELGSPILYELGLEEAVESLAEHYEKEYGLHIKVEKDPLPEFLEDATRLILFRALQELLTNVVKHAEADNIWVSLKVGDNQVTLQVRDDGRGFDVKADSSHWYRHLGFGLFSLRERLSQLGGELEVESHPGQGTLVWLSLPLTPQGLVTH